MRLDYALGWFRFRHIPVVAQQAQIDTYLTCRLVAEVIKQLADSYVRAYFVEQLQGMLLPAQERAWWQSGTGPYPKEPEERGR